MAAEMKSLGKTAFNFSDNASFSHTNKLTPNSRSIINIAICGDTESMSAFANILGTFTIMYSKVHAAMLIKLGSFSPGVLVFLFLSKLI